jgi:hypothetical protein
VLVEENHSYPEVIGNSAMPNFNSLAAQYGLATQHFAVAHRSIPNYLLLTTGLTESFDEHAADHYLRRGQSSRPRPRGWTPRHRHRQPQSQKKGFQSTNTYQHQSLVRLILAGSGVNSLPGLSAVVPDMAEFFTGP